MWRSTLLTLWKMFVPAPLVWGIATCLVKCSILAFYADIFQKPGFRLPIYVMAGLSVALALTTILQSFLLCHPFKYSWDKTVPGGSCAPSKQAYLSVAIVNLIIDLSIVALPMPILWSLQMRTAKKVAISAILSIGLV